MSKLAKITFTKAAAPKGGVAVVLAGEDLSFGQIANELLSGLEGGFARVAEIAGFEGKKKPHWILSRLPALPLID